MVRLIVGVVILVLLGVLFALNSANSTPLNLFGYELKNVPVIAVAIAGFVLGVLYSFILYFLRFVARRHRASLKDKDREVRSREKVVQDQEKRLETLAEDLSAANDAGQASGLEEPGARSTGKRRRGR